MKNHVTLDQYNRGFDGLLKVEWDVKNDRERVSRIVTTCTEDLEQAGTVKEEGTRADGRRQLPKR
ncbi:MAG: hypothetical protein ACFFD4_16520 [Candidatus Odinarchaeota archaeon]